MSVMTADVRTFTADSMQDALDVVRQEMGSDAVILHTRHIEKRRFFPWLKSRQEVEITAGLGVKTGAATLRTAETSEESSHVATATRRLISADDLAPPPQLLKTETAAKPQVSSPAVAVSSRTGARAPIPARPDSVAPRKPMKPLPPTVQLSTPTIPSLKTPDEDSTAEIHKRLDALQQALAELTRQAKTRIGDEVPIELFSHYTKLLRADVDETLARDLVMRLKREATAEQVANPQTSAGLLMGLVESEIRCAPPIRAARGRRKVVAVVGPTGVGKTTTLAKLAANFRLKDGLKVGLVTVDTYRVAAVEQLRTYAEIIDLPMKVVTNPAEMRKALDELSGVDLVLVDTAGRSPNDELKLQELNSLLEAGVDEIHLVLSLSTGAKSLIAAVEKFSSLKLTSIIATKLDETAHRGALLTLAREVAWPISYLTTGQNVPEDIEPAHAARLAKWVMEGGL